MPSDGLFGVHGAALEVRSQRMGVLASNIANAENAIQYQTTLSFLNGRIGQITRALRGE